MRKRILIVAGIIAVIALLAGAAFVGALLLNGQGLPGLASAGGLNLVIGEGGQAAHPISIHLQPAKELPQQPADAEGVFDHRQDNSLFVGTGQVKMMVIQDQSGNVTSSASHDGPTVEVVVTPQTTIYRDVTMKQFDGPPPSGSRQQVVEPGLLDEIGQESDIHAWGKKTGDRIIADVLVYTPPPVMGK